MEKNKKEEKKIDILIRWGFQYPTIFLGGAFAGAIVYKYYLLAVQAGWF